MRKYLALALLLVLLVACGGGSTQGNKGVWDNGKWDQATWQ